MAYNHGISTRETATPVSAAVGGDSGLQVVIGTAPVNMAADPAAAVNTHSGKQPGRGCPGAGLQWRL